MNGGSKALMQCGTCLVDRWPGVRFALARTQPRTAVVLVAAMLFSALLQGRDVPVPLIPGDAVVRTSPLLPLLVALPLLDTTVASMAQLEATIDSGRMLRARLVWATTILACCGAMTALCAAAGDREGAGPAAAAANSLSFIGLGLVGGAALGGDLCWIPPCVLALCTFFFGKDADSQVRAWAWLLHSPDGWLPWTVGAALMLIGATAYASSDSTGSLARRAHVS